MSVSGYTVEAHGHDRKNNYHGFWKSDRQRSNYCWI